MGIVLTHRNRKSNHFAAPGRAASTEEKRTVFRHCAFKYRSQLLTLFDAEGDRTGAAGIPKIISVDMWVFC